MDKDFEVEISGLGFNQTGYPGAFTPTINNIVHEVISTLKRPNVLHLFSGVSEIGDIRIDIMCKEATLRENVLSFIKRDKKLWNLCILDPPYEIKRKSKLYKYGRTSSVAADVLLRRALVDYFRGHVKNILWLDMCAPLPKGFKRRKLWFLFPGGYHTIRVMSWLVNTNERLGNNG